MILGFVGKSGSGKSLSIVKNAYYYFKKGFKIYSNMKLNFNYYEYNIDVLLGFINNDTQLNNAVLIMDEAHIILDSRRSASKVNLIVSYLLLQSRKRNMHVFYSTQYFHQVDKRLRSHTDYILECKKIIRNNNVIILQKIINTGDFSYTDKGYVGNPYFQLYDTNYIINPFLKGGG